MSPATPVDLSGPITDPTMGVHALREARRLLEAVSVSTIAGTYLAHRMTDAITEIDDAILSIRSER